MENHDLVALDNIKLRRRATYASVVVAITLIASKLSAYFLTDSVAMLSSLLDSTVDLIASLVTVYGVANALRPPDHDHRFGHGKAEPLAALAQAAFIVGSSVLLAYEALAHIYQPRPLQNEMAAYIVMGISTILTILLLEYQNFVIRRTKSMAIRADRMHYAGDLAINIAVVLAFLLYKWTGITWLDPLFAILISGWLISGAYKIARHALDVLMDKELPDDERQKIIDIVNAHPAVHGVHDMRTRSDSDHIFIELHVEIDGSTSIRTGHDIAEQIAANIVAVIPNADVLIHNDPAGYKENRLDTRIEKSATP